MEASEPKWVNPNDVIYDMGLTHLGSDASIYMKLVLKLKIFKYSLIFQKTITGILKNWSIFKCNIINNTNSNLLEC